MSAWVELHAALAAENAYDVQDEDGRALDRTTNDLLACEDETCARRAVSATPFARTYEPAIAPFLEHRWPDLTTSTSRAIDAVRAAWVPEADGAADVLARELDATWPSEPVPVAVVTLAPSPAPRALVSTALAGRSRCFEREKDDTDRLYHARIVDCVLVRAALPLRSRSALFSALGDREWTMIVVHAAALAVTGFEPKHGSVYRRSAAAVEPRAMAWLAEHWREHRDGKAFVERFRAALEP